MPRSRSIPTPVPEGPAFTCPDGSLKLSRNHLALLQGLLDRPDATAASRRDLVAAARPHIRPFRGDMPSDRILDKAVDTLHPWWVDKRREGRAMTYQLSQRGRDIVEGRVEVRVSGRSRYKPDVPKSASAWVPPKGLVPAKLRRRFLVLEVIHAPFYSARSWGCACSMQEAALRAFERRQMESGGTAVVVFDRQEGKLIAWTDSVTDPKRFVEYWLPGERWEGVPRPPA